MSFRRDNERPRQWRRWIARHRDHLAECGLPDWLYGDELRWLRFLEEGLDRESGWQVESLTPRQAGRFRGFLLREYGPDDYPGCFRSLEMVIRGTARTDVAYPPTPVRPYPGG